MGKFIKKPVIIEAYPWRRNGDHPDDGAEVLEEGEFKGQLSEGNVVRYFRRPNVHGGTKCKKCGKAMYHHGWVDTEEGGHIVCPGDWIIKGVEGEYYPCKPLIFEKTYEPA